MKSKLIMVMAVLLFAGGAVQAADSVAVAVYNKTAGALVEENGNIYLLDESDNPQSYEIQISIENSGLLGGMSLGFKVESPDDVTWTWDAQTGGLGTSASVTVVPGSRCDPHMTVWDLGGLLVTEQDFDGMAIDSVLLGGLALSNGMVAGPMEHMLSWHFTPGGVADGETKHLCIDSAFIPPAGQFLFSVVAGPNVTPAIAPAACYTVTYKPTSDASDIYSGVPHTYSLAQNRPNPFNPFTTIEYSLARKSEVNVSVYNILGQKVVTLVDGELDAGPHQAVWDGNDGNGDQVASGIYFYKMVTDDFVRTRKMALMR